MLNIYARTFMIATMTGPLEPPRRRETRRGWIAGAWHRLVARHG